MSPHEQPMQGELNQSIKGQREESIQGQRDESIQGERDKPIEGKRVICLTVSLMKQFKMNEIN